MLKSSSELPDESLDSDELSDDASESDSSLELLSFTSASSFDFWEWSFCFF